MYRFKQANYTLHITILANPTHNLKARLMHLCIASCMIYFPLIANIGKPV